MHVFLLDRRNDKLLKIHTQNIEGFWYNIQPNNFDISTIELKFVDHINI